MDTPIDIDSNEETKSTPADRSSSVPRSWEEMVPEQTVMNESSKSRNDNKRKFSDSSEAHDTSIKKRNCTVSSLSDTPRLSTAENHPGQEENGESTDPPHQGRLIDKYFIASDGECSDSTEDADSWHVVNNRRKRTLRSKRPPPLNKSQTALPEPTVFKYPVLIEDLGTGSDNYAKYGAATNSVWGYEANHCGKISSQRKCRHPNQWMIECRTFSQQQHIAQMTKLKTHEGEIHIKASIPEATTEGVIRPINKEWSEDKIRQLIEENRPSVQIKSINRLHLKPENGQDQVRSNAVKITFLSKHLPSEIKVGTQFFYVDPFRKQVRRCMKCQKLDHLAKECTKTARCPRGCFKAHPQGVKECPRLDPSEWYCVNCKTSGHSAAFPGCPTRKQLSKAQELKATHYMPLGVALKEVKVQRREEEHQRQTQLFRPGRSSTPTDPRTSGINFADMVKEAKYATEFPEIISVWDTSRQATRSATPVKTAGKPVGNKTNKTLQSAATGSQSSQRNDKQQRRQASSNSDPSKKSSLPEAVMSSNQPQVRGDLEEVMSTLQRMSQILNTRLDEMDKRLQKQAQDTQDQISTLSSQVKEIQEERKIQLKNVETIVLENRNVDKDPLRKIAYCIIDGLRKTALGDSGAFLEALFQIVPSEVTQNIGHPPKMTEELQLAVMNIIGLTPVGKHG